MNRPVMEETYISVASAARSLFGKITAASTRRVRRLYEGGHLRGRRIGEKGWIELSLEDVERCKRQHRL